MNQTFLSESDIANRLEDLPTLPSVIYELSQVINDPMSSTSDVEKLMSTDQSLTTKVLKLVNSPYYAIPGGVSSLGRAIAYIGYDAVHQLVLSASILEALEVTHSSSFNLKEFWKHCLGVAIASETIARFARHPTPSDLFTCGLVHDMGKVALLSLEPEMVVATVEFANQNNLSYAEAELELRQTPHTRVGHLVARQWSLPTMLSTVTQHHHSESGERDNLTHDLNQAVDIVYLGNLFTHALKFGNSGHKKVLGAPKDIMRRLTIDPDKDFKPLLQQIQQNLEHSSDFARVLGSAA